MNESIVEANPPPTPPTTTQDRPEPEIAFRFPSGAPARFALYRKGESGNPDRYRRTWFHPDLLKLAKSKAACPKLACWNRDIPEQLIVGDFDKLPEGYESFDELYGALKVTFSDSALVVRTYSDKVKVIFLAGLSGETMSVETAVSFLEKRLEPRLFASVDKCKAALTILGLTPSIVTELQKRLPFIPVYRVEHRASNTPNSSIPILKRYEFTSYVGPLEALSPKIRRYIGRSGVREKVARCLVYRSGLAKDDGFCLSSLMLAKQFKVRQASVSKALLKAQSDGLLNVTDHNFRTGADARGKRYVALGALKEEIERLAPGAPIQAPASIEDGEWHDELLRLSQKHYRRPDEFLEAVRGIPGWNLKNRYKEAIELLNWWRRVNKLPAFQPKAPPFLNVG